MRVRRRKPWILLSGLIAVALAVLYFIGMSVWLGVYGHDDTVTYSEDAAIVLGAGIRGEVVTTMLKFRLDEAVLYSQRNPDALIVVSGGQGPGEDITEALAMERYLIERGVAADRIIKEEAATSTYENLLYSKEILDGLLEEPYTVTIITNAFHLFRAAYFAERLELDATRYGAGINWRNVPFNYGRECLAVVKMWLAGK